MTKDKKDKKPFVPPAPVNVSDGIPDRVESPSRRLLGVLLAWTAWMGFLLYVLLAARV